MIKSNYLLFDCETGGLDWEKNPITEFAAIILEPYKLTEIARWSTFVKPYNNLVIDQESLKRTMVSMTDVKRGMDIKDFQKGLKGFLKENQVKTRFKDAGRLVPVGHNVKFDIGFCTYALALANISWNEFVYENHIDTETLSKMTWGLTGEEKLKLGFCCERAGIDLTDAHGAMNDTEATADLFRFFTKRLRSKKVVADAQTEKKERPKGQEFFEFKCGK